MTDDTKQMGSAVTPEDRISKDTRRAVEWQKIGMAVVVLLLIITLININVGIPLMLAHFANKADVAGQAVVKEGQEFLKQEADNLAEDRKLMIEVIKGLQTDTHNALEPVGPAVKQIGITVGKVGGTVDETTKTLAFLRENNLKHLDDAEVALLPVLHNLADLAQKFGVSVEALTKAITEVAGSAQEAVAEIKKVFADDRISKLFDELVVTGGNIAAISDSMKGIFANFKLASDQAPQIAQLWAKIMKTGSRLQIPLAIAQMLGLLTPLLKPIFGIGP